MYLRTQVSRRAALTGAAGLGALGFLAACSPPKDGSDSTGSDASTVEMVINNSPAYKQPLSAVLGADFIKRTGVTVKYTITGQSTLDSVDQRVRTDLAAGHINDIAIIGSNQIASYVEAGRAVPMDSLVSAAKFDTGQLYPSMVGLGTHNGQLYSLPFAVSTLVLFYNKDAFIKAGLDPEKPPTTFSELEAYSKEIVASKAAKYGASWGNDNSGNWVFQNFLFSNGGSMLGSDGKTPMFAEAPGVGVIDYWAGFFKQGLGVTMGQTELQDAFIRGDVAMMLQADAYLSGVTTSAKFKVGTAVMPIPDGGSRRCPGAGAAMVILSNSAPKQKAAFTVISELLSPAGDTVKVKMSSRSPVNRTAVTSDQYLAQYFVENPLYAPALKQFDDLVPWFAWPGQQSAEITKAVDQEITLALRGNKSAASALSDAAKRAETLLVSQ